MNKADSKQTETTDIFADSNAEIAKLKSEVERLQNENGEQAKKIVSLEEQINKLEADKTNNKTENETEKFVEIVALPIEGVKVPELIVKGVKVKREIDNDGFHHFFTTKEHAQSLLANAAGLKFVLIGPDKKMELRIRKGLEYEKVTVYRHNKTKTTKGIINWVPVVEDSK